MFVTKYTSMAKFHFASTYDSKEISKSVTSLCSKYLMTSQILKFVEFTKTQKSRYLKKETLFFLQIKKFINWATLWQKILLQRC